MGRVSLGILGMLLVTAHGVWAQQTAPTAIGYGANCASCHGASLTGAAGPSILMYVRYHTNAELAGVLKQHRPALQPTSPRSLRRR